MRRKTLTPEQLNEVRENMPLHVGLMFPDGDTVSGKVVGGWAAEWPIVMFKVKGVALDITINWVQAYRILHGEIDKIRL